MSKSIELSLLLLIEIAAAFLLGMLFIPVLRSKKTGRYERKLGSRFKTDGSEPSMGGLPAAIAFSVCFFPLAVRASLAASLNSQDTRAGLIGAGFFAVLVMLIGLNEDRLKQFLGRPVGAKPMAKQLMIFGLSLFLLIWLTMNSRESAEILLPFHLGYIEFGVLYYPLMALAMTLSINAFKLHFCFGSEFRSSVGGLIEVTGAASLLTVCICADICSREAAGVFSAVASACCIGMLVWTFSPSKLISGESGAMFIGALFTASVVLSKLELLLVFAALPQIADITVAAVHFIRYKNIRSNDRSLTDEENGALRRPLRLLFREKGAGDHLNLLLFLCLSLIGAALSLIYAVYAEAISIKL